MTAPAEAPGFRVLRYRFGEAAIDLYLPEDAPAKLVTRVIPRYLAPDDASGAAGTIMLLRGSEGWSLALPDGREATFDTLDETLAFLEHGTTLAFLGLDSTFFQLHGAGTVAGGRAVVALGRSGKGKTSMAMHWSARLGLPTLGDDVVLLDQDGTAHPFRRLFRVPRERAALHPGLPEGSELMRRSPGEKVWVDPEWFGGWADPAPLGVVGWVERRAGAGLAVEELDPAEALALMLGARFTLAGPESPERHSAYVDACLEVLERAAALKVTFDDSAEAAEELLSRL